MTLTYRIHSFTPSRNARRALIRACEQVSNRETSDRPAASVCLIPRENMIQVRLDEFESQERNPDIDARKACIRDASRVLKDVMLKAGFTFNADLAD